MLGHLPKDQHPQVKAAFRAAMKLDAKQGEQKLEQLARWLKRDHPSASASLREGLSEMFTINRNLSTTMGHSTGLIREQCPVW